jgi:two-component system sensor histidine kinase/response regulator
VIEVADDKPSILVVDDNPLIVSVVKNLLQANNYQVATAGNGREALDLLGHRAVDVIICDVMMPKMDGYKLHHWVRAKAEFSHIPFVFLTALDTDQEMLKGHESGADDYLTKPFDPRDLLAVVRGKILRSRGIKSSTENRYDNYRRRVIHTLSHEFRTPLVAINTGTEMLMEQLVSQHGNLDADKINNLLEAVHRGGQRLERLVNDFMLLQQIDAGVAQKVYDSRAEQCAVSSLLETFLKMIQSECDRAGVKLSFDSCCGESMVRIYQPQVLEILRRVTENGIKFSPKDRVLDIFAYRQEDEIIIEIRDRGIGFDPAKIREALEAFGQIDREKLEQQGGGLGLAIAYKYALINKCKLLFATRHDGGSSVSLVFPVLK